MLDYIHLYDNGKINNFNKEFLSSENDISIVDLVLMVMKETEAIENIEILSYEVIMDQSEIDINQHMVNINFKKKRDDTEIPKNKYVSHNRYGEIVFKVRVFTNLEEKIITKRILIPIEDEAGFYDLASKKCKAIWQLVDASTYSQRGKITLKSRMPIIIYKSKPRLITDVDAKDYNFSTFSYALNTKTRRKKSTVKAKNKFINPILIYSAKVGLDRAIEYFGFGKIVTLVREAVEADPTYAYFPIDGFKKDKTGLLIDSSEGFYARVDRDLLANYPLLQNFIGMLYHIKSIDFPVEFSNRNNTEYWICRIGLVGSTKNKNLLTFLEKGKTTIYMIERLLDSVTIMNLRLPMEYKKDIYRLMRWMILDFDNLKNRNNLDISNKRIRKNEYIVLSTLGRKVAENINKIIEKKSKSRQNNLETLLELFNFGSDIIVSGMRNLNDLVKSDELVNDLTFLQDMQYSAKGPNSLGEASGKTIPMKYRGIHPSYVGVIDLNVSSNSDVGMSGSFVPTVQIYDRFYFTPDKEPCENLQEVYKMKLKYLKGSDLSLKDIKLDKRGISSYMQIEEHNHDIPYEKIEIIEKEV